MMSKEGIKGLKFSYPECWNNDVRMDVLFAPFRPRNVNPENYDSKLHFWKGMLEKFCEFKGSCDFSRVEVAKIFVRNNKVPYGLQTVIDDMIICKEIRLKGDFVSDPLNSWSHWAVTNFVKKPFNWGIHLISQANNDETDPQYIHLGVLQTQSEELCFRLRDHSGKVLSFEKIAEFEKDKLSNGGLCLCLQYLHCLKKIYLHHEGDKKKILVKVPGHHESASPLTDVDRAIYNLENIQEKILKDTEILETDLKLNDEKIRQFIHEGKRVVAKNYLRRKHLLESRIDKKNKSLDNVHALLSQVHEAQSHGEILDAYKIGSNTLKNLLSKTDMNVDSIDEVMTNVKEVIDIHDEIQQTMGSPINESTDDSILEKELNELLKCEEKQRDTEAMQTEVDSLLKKQLPGLNEKEDEDILAQLEKLEIETTNLPTEPLKPTKIQPS